MKKFYDAEYIIRKNNEYEELHIYYSPVEVKFRKMIAEATMKCKLQNEKCKIQKAKLEAKKQEKLKAQSQALERGM